MTINDEPNKAMRVSSTEEIGEDGFILAKLSEIEGKCTGVSKDIFGKDVDYALAVIKTICVEVASLKLSIAVDRPRQGWYTYDSVLARNIESIVFKMDLLADKYFSGSYNIHLISSDKSCNSKDKLYELVDTWLSDRRTMIDVLSTMVDEIKGLGVTTKPLTRKKEGLFSSISKLASIIKE